MGQLARSDERCRGGPWLLLAIGAVSACFGVTIAVEPCLTAIPSTTPTPSRVDQFIDSSQLSVCIARLCPNSSDGNSTSVAYSVLVQRVPALGQNFPFVIIDAGNSSIVNNTDVEPAVEYFITAQWLLNGTGMVTPGVATIVMVPTNNVAPPSSGALDVRIGEITTTTIAISYFPPLQPNNVISMYRISAGNDSAVLLEQLTEMTTYTITNLSPDTLYVITVAASNRGNSTLFGPESSAVQATTRAQALQFDNPLVIFLQNSVLRAGPDLSSNPIQSFSAPPIGTVYTDWNYVYDSMSANPVHRTLILAEQKNDVVNVTTDIHVYMGTVLPAVPQVPLPTRFSLEFTSPDVVLSNLPVAVSALAYDWVNRRLYMGAWSMAASMGSILLAVPDNNLANFPSPPTEFLGNLTDSIGGLAVDPAHGFLYFTLNSTGRLMRVDLGSRQVVAILTSYNITNFQLDLEESRLVFASNNRIFMYSLLTGGSPTQSPRVMGITNVREFAEYFNFVTWFHSDDFGGSAVGSLEGTTDRRSFFPNIGDMSTGLRILRSGLQPRPIAETPVRDFQVLVFSTSARLSWRPPSSSNLGVGAFSIWSYRITGTLVDVVNATSICELVTLTAPVASSVDVVLTSTLLPSTQYSFLVHPYDNVILADEDPCATPVDGRYGAVSVDVRVFTLRARNAEPAVIMSDRSQNTIRYASVDGNVSGNLLSAVNNPVAHGYDIQSGVVLYARDGGSSVSFSSLTTPFVSFFSSPTPGSTFPVGLPSVLSPPFLTQSLNTAAAATNRVRMAVDYIGKRFFWSTGRGIYYSSYNAGSESVQALAAAVGNIADLTLDVQNGYVYWVNSNTFHVALMNTNYCQTRQLQTAILSPVPTALSVGELLEAVAYAADSSRLYFTVVTGSQSVVKYGTPNPILGQLLNIQTIYTTTTPPRPLAPLDSKVFFHFQNSPSVSVIDTQLSTRVPPYLAVFPATSVLLSDISVISENAQPFNSCLSNLPGDATPMAPANLRVVTAATTDSVVVIQWDASPPTCTGRPILYNILYRTTQHGMDQPVLPELDCPIQLMSTSIVLDMLSPATRVDIVSLQAFSTWLPSAVVSAVFFSLETAPTGSPANPRVFYSCNGTSCRVMLRWNTIAVGSRNGNITSYDVRFGAVGAQLDVFPSLTNLSFSMGGLSPGMYSFEVRGTNGAGMGPYSAPETMLFRANGGVFVPEILFTSGATLPGSITVFDMDTLQPTQRVVVSDSDIIDAATRDQYRVQFIQFGSHTGETFWVAAIGAVTWSLRYQNNSTCTLRSEASVEGAARAVHGLAYDWIGRVLYTIEQRGNMYSVYELRLPTTPVCTSQLGVTALSATPAVLRGLSLSPASGTLYYIQNSEVTWQVVGERRSAMATAGQAQRPLTSRKRRQLPTSAVLGFTPVTALHYSAVQDRTYIAVATSGATIFICPNLNSTTNESDCQQFSPAHPFGTQITNLYSDATLLYWTVQGEDTTLYYQRLDQLSGGIMMISKNANSPVLAFGMQLQPLPSLACLLPGVDNGTRAAPILIDVAHSTINITVPTPTLSTECLAETSSLAPSTVTVDLVQESNNMTMTVSLFASNAVISDLVPFTTYSVTVVSYSNTFGTTTLTDAESLSVMTLTGLPGAPVNINVTVVGPDAVYVSWSAPAVTNGVLTQYRVLAVPSNASSSAGNRSVVDQTGQTALTMTGLTPDTTYNISVLASTSFGEGPASAPVNAVTTLQAPRDTRIVQVQSGTIDLDCANSASVPCTGVALVCQTRPLCTATTCGADMTPPSVTRGDGNRFVATGVQGEVVYSVVSTYMYPLYSYSATLGQAVTGAGTAPDTPMGLQVVSTTTNTYVYSWLAPGCRQDSSATGYRLEVTAMDGTVVMLNELIVTSSQDSSRLQTDTTQDNSYSSVVLFATNGVGQSSPSNMVEFANVPLDNSSSTSLGLIIGVACGGGVFLILLIIITIIIYRRRNDKPLQPVTIINQNGDFNNGFLENRFYGKDFDQPDVEIDADLEPFIISLDQLRIGDDLGKGNFGLVREAWYQPADGEEVLVAVKSSNSSEGDKEFLKEAAIMLDMSDAHILKCYGLCVQPRVWLVMELCDGGNLLVFLEKCKHQMEGGVVLSVLEVVTMMEDITSGMLYLEQQHKVHRDLAARNVLIANNPMSHERKLKISDFGLTRDTYTEEYIMDLTARDKALPIRWVAPECMMRGVFDSKTDVWAFGVVCWELGSLGDTPYGNFRSTREIVDEVKRGLKLQRPPYLTKEMYLIMVAATHYRPERRANFSQLLTMVLQYKESIRECMNLDVFMMQRYTHNPMSPDEYFTAEETGEAEILSGITRVESIRRSARRILSRNVAVGSAAAAAAGDPEAIPLTNLEREARMSGRRQDTRNQYVDDIAARNDDANDPKNALFVNVATEPTSPGQDNYNVPRPAEGAGTARPPTAPKPVRNGALAVTSSRGRLESEVPDNYSFPSSEPAAVANGTYSNPKPTAASTFSGQSTASSTSRGQLQSEVPVNYNWPSSQPTAANATSAHYSHPLPAAASTSSGASTFSNASSLQSEVPVNYNWPSSEPAQQPAKSPPARAGQYQHPRNASDSDGARDMYQHPRAANDNNARVAGGASGRLASTDSIDVQPAPWMTQEDLQRARPEPRPRAGTRNNDASPTTTPASRPQPSPRTARQTREPSLEETAAGNAQYSNKFLSNQSTKKKKPPPPQRRDTLEDHRPVQLTGMRRLNSDGGTVAGSAVPAKPAVASPTEEFEMTL